MTKMGVKVRPLHEWKKTLEKFKDLSPPVDKSNTHIYAAKYAYRLCIAETMPNGTKNCLDNTHVVVGITIWRRAQ
jgi:hypothetical protein